MHPAAFFALDGWRSTGFAGTGLCAAALARQHRPGIAGMILRHFFFELLFVGTGAATSLSIMGIGNFLS
jgi:hypothetical protein